jgi:hypothetical protein
MRTRLLKPGFFTNEHLARLPVRARLLFAGLWLLADREGRIEYRPERIKAAIFPYERVRIEPLIRCLTDAGFVKSYHGVYTRCLALPTFAKNQHPHAKEPASLLPAPPIEPRSDRDETCTRPADTDTDTDIDQDQDQPAASRPVRIPFKRYAAIGAHVLDVRPPTTDLGELAERFKTICARQHLPYDAAITQKAIDAGIRSRARRRA